MLSRLTFVWVGGALAALALVLAAPPTLANGDPVNVVRELYRVHAEGEKSNVPVWRSSQRDHFFSRRLLTQLERDAKRREPRLSFDPVYDGQDFKISDLAVEAGGTRGGNATVVASFKNFGEQRRLTYRLAREGGSWRVVEITKTGAQGWALTKLLAGK